jgi:hypothetical protein
MDPDTDRLGKEVLSMWSYVPPWRLYHAEQMTLARRADALLETSRKLPVLPDLTTLRQWWLPGSVRHSAVQEEVLPLLMGRGRCADIEGIWARRAAEESSSSSTCWRLALPEEVVWRLLRFAGHLGTDSGSQIGIAATRGELLALQTDVLGTAPWRDLCIFVCLFVDQFC